MAHYAYLDDNNVVTRVIVGRDEGDEGVDWEQYYGALRTSYNTQANRHIHGGTPFRGNFAGVGYTYDPLIGPDGAFIPPSPFPSWVLDVATVSWVAPVPYPDGAGPMDYYWDEDSLSWVKAPALT